MQQPVKAAELGLDHGGQFIVLMGLGGFEIERNDHRLRMTGGLDLVIDLAQVGLGLAQQQHGGAVSGISFGRRCTDATASAGNQDHPVLEQVGAG